ncbi:RIP metalloprotease RseP [Deferribacter autotrophicus]|uniref:Zinc metalloprotease n=1 Tax=Deferribacter autotrophicus TaxID=500465 RepID=A0A5A8F1Y4_9BACT|nr:RIP metalloprotease RseP [Deferribacter autotrophicus]KAA0257751.1 RIP metalloprotease RseP [Deferribacter autotrophicus]
MGIISAILVFGVLVFIHEFGHFIFAKLFGVKVLRFSIGFGPVIFAKKWGETEYALSLIPLGGYVKMYGENLEEGIDESDRDRAFLEKPVWHRFFIVFAGPLFNYLLAIFVFALLFVAGVNEFLPVVGEVKKDMPAYSAGIKTGDKILEIDGRPIKYWDEMSQYIKGKAGEKIVLKIERDGKILNIEVVPKKTVVKNIFGEDKEVGLVGIVPKGDTVLVRYNPVKAIILGLEKTNEITKLTLVGIVKIIQKVVPADNIGGPIMIFQMAKQTAETGVASLLAFMAVISINLAILNLLPIPVLDGGHLFFYIIEIIRGRPVSVRVREIAQYIGLALLIALMFFAFYNDISRIVSK